MPYGNRTGPMGQGPRTGRTLGFCSGYDSPGYIKGFEGSMGSGFGYGRGRGRGNGFGRGRGNGFGRGRNFGWPFTGSSQGLPLTQAISKDEEVKMLKDQAESLKRSQKDIEKRLSELEKESE